MSSSKILFFICLSFIIGIVLGFIVKIPQYFLLGFLLMAIFGIFVFLLIRKDSFVVVGFCLLFLITGILRMQISEFNVAQDKISKLNGRGQVVLTGIIFDGPDVRETTQKLKVKVDGSVILVTTAKYPEYQYLDTVKITGKLEAPMVSDDFNYKNYLLKDHIYSVINSAKMELLSQKHKYNIFSYSYEKILFLKENLDKSIQNNFLPPHSLILEGIILGNNKNMTQDLRDKLSASGLRFLTAISGVHVIILSAILLSFLLFLGFKRNWALYLSIILIWLYVVITGFTASGIRAAIMGSIFIFAEIFGRQNTSSRTIVLAGALMLLQNPLLLFYDIGFQLSFLASIGIIYLKPILSIFFKFLFMGKIKELSEILSVTFAAQIFILPITVFNFGKITLLSPLANILVLPVMPWILSFGFLFSIFGAISNVLGWIFFLPCWFLISYFLKIVDFFSQPQMAKSVSNISWVWVALIYLFITVGTWFLKRKFTEKIV